MRGEKREGDDREKRRAVNIRSKEQTKVGNNPINSKSLYS